MSLRVSEGILFFHNSVCMYVYKPKLKPQGRARVSQKWIALPVHVQDCGGDTHHVSGSSRSGVTVFVSESGSARCADNLSVLRPPLRLVRLPYALPLPAVAFASLLRLPLPCHALNFT